MNRTDALTLLEHFVAAYNTGDPVHFERCLAPDYRRPDPRTEQGRTGMQAAVQRWRAAVDPISLVLEDAVVEGDRIVARMTFSGRQVGEIMGIAPTGRTFSIGLIDIFEVRDGLLARHWDQMDLFGLHRQLGATPAPASA